ncbi:MAG: hypothetical protein QT04_C0030G0010 [archaeon GW2011_AR11]|nr:MAG: hypothetical protein QT04_C0030G0010 [archaeon GW2011_AR11]
MRFQDIDEAFVLDALQRYDLLLKAGSVNKGKKTVILCSGADKYGCPSLEEHEEHLTIARHYKEKIGDSASIVQHAASEHLEEILNDRNINNVFVSGHASYGCWMATDRLVRWTDVSEMATDHLKQGLFVKLGCNTNPPDEQLLINGQDYPVPLGYFAVAKHEAIYYGRWEIMRTGELQNPRYLVNYERNSLDKQLQALTTPSLATTG